MNKGYGEVKEISTKVMFDYVCKPVGGEFITSEETSESCWVKKEKAFDYISHSAIQTRYQAYLDFDQKKIHLFSTYHSLNFVKE